eukprot:EG_transcript_30851
MAEVYYNLGLVRRHWQWWRWEAQQRQQERACAAFREAQMLSGAFRRWRAAFEAWGLPGHRPDLQAALLQWHRTQREKVLCRVLTHWSSLCYMRVHRQSLLEADRLYRRSLKRRIWRLWRQSEWCAASLRHRDAHLRGAAFQRW